MLLPLQYPQGQRPVGSLKSEPEYFQVDEVPLAAPTGEGAFEQVWVRKRDLPTHKVVRALAQHLGVGVDQIGVAGFKDRRALTNQHLTVPAGLLSKGWPEVEGVLEWRALGLTQEPLRPGQLQANRFRILVSGSDIDPARLEQCWERQRATGWANYYGVQRFGKENLNWEAGLQQLRHPPARAQLRRWPHNFVLNSVQGQLFNQFLQARVQAKRFADVRTGDWCARGEQHFQARGSGAERAELREFAIEPLGPIWGYKLDRPTGEELRLLKPLGIDAESFRPFRAPGSRRPLRLPLPAIDWTPAETGMWAAFELPPGAYATVLLEHFFRLEYTDH